MSAMTQYLGCLYIGVKAKMRKAARPLMIGESIRRCVAAFRAAPGAGTKARKRSYDNLSAEKNFLRRFPGLFEDLRFRRARS
jgi:hypothetical protein